MVLSKRRQQVLSGGDKSESEQLQEEPRVSEIPVSVNPKGSTGKEEL